MRRRLVHRFTTLFRTEDGHEFLGQLGDPNSSTRPNKEIQNLPHRTLAVSRNSVAREGMVVSALGVRHILFGQHTMGNIQKFLVVQVSQTVVWSRLETLIDPVTNMKSGTSTVILDPALPCLLEPGRVYEEQRFSKTMYSMITGSPVRPGDFIDGKPVLASSYLLGLWLVDLA